MSEEPVQYEVDPLGLARVTLNSPETRNALSDDLLDALLAALVRARDDGTARVVVLGSSHPSVFSAGGDLKGFADARSPVDKYAGLDRFPRLFTLVGNLGKPVVCAVNGHVLAGAFGLALACDLVIAKKGATFGCPEINVGVFPFMISALMYRSINRMKANELMLLGQRISAHEALEFGIVNKVVEPSDFEDAVADWASQLAAKSPLLMRLGKNALAASRDLSLPEALDAMQAQLALALTTEDLAEGVAAFREKRTPAWRHR